MESLTLITYIIVLLFSVIIHELAHGYMAEALGDPTARLAGRLTLNPLRHLDPWGSVIVPILLIIFRSPILLGWAKPVPFNPMNFKRHRRWGGALVAVAGPLSNIALAIIFSIVIRVASSDQTLTPTPFLGLAAAIVLLNIGLAIFNLIPIPPLDGHHILFSFLSSGQQRTKYFITRYSPIIFIIVLLFLWRFIEYGIIVVFKIFAGAHALSLLTLFHS